MPAEQPWTAAELRLIHSLSPPPALAPSPGNAVADNAAAAALGHKLFFDKQLSANGQVACATCHMPDRYFTDGRLRARGIADTARNAPTILGAQNLPFVFHDGRKDSLWAQALGPLEAPAEHGFDRVAVVHRVVAAYRAEFEALFGPVAAELVARLPAHARPVALERTHPLQQAWAALSAADRGQVDHIFACVGKAIEAYERKLVARPAPFDGYVAALDKGDAQGAGAMSPAARRGLRAFVGAAGCINCHNGPQLSDHGFHNLGLPPVAGQVGVDGGRAIGADQVKHDPFRCGTVESDQKQCLELQYLKPQFEDFMGAFKTPSLRNVAKTAPYMHAGQFGSLQEVVAFYKALPGQAEVGHRELTLQKLPAAVATDDLIAFLGTLTGALPDARWTQPPGAL